MIFLSVLYSKAASMQTADVHSSVAAEHRSAAAFDSRVPWKLNGHCRANAGWLLKGDDSWPRWTCLAYRLSCLPSIYRCNFICMRSQAKSTVLNKEAESHNAERKQVEENYRYWCTDLYDTHLMSKHLTVQKRFCSFWKVIEKNT